MTEQDGPVRLRHWRDVAATEPGGSDDDARASLGERVGQAAVGKRFELVPFDQITVGSGAVYLVKGLIPRVGLTVLFGPPKCGKSFWLFDVLMHVALGWDYRERRVKRGSVVYCAFEGAEGFKARVEAFRRDKLFGNEGHIPFHLVAARMAFQRDHADLIASIRATLGDEKPAAIVLDTLRRSLVGSESDDKDISSYIEAADAVRETFDCAVVIVHHSGLEGGRPRGSTSLPGAADAQLSCEKDDRGNVVVTVQLMKDGPEGDTVHSVLRVVDVGVDEDGDPITSLVVDPIEGVLISSKAARASKLTKTAQIALDALREVIDERGAKPPAAEQIPDSVTKAVTKAQWREHAVRRGISTSEKESAVRMALDRASTALVAGRYIGVWNEHVWPV